MDTFAELTSGAHAGAAGIGSGQIITAEQARASNYKKGRVKLHGFDIAIETPAGQRRTGKSDGQPWSVICMAHYGDITGTKASDGDPLDVFIGPWPESERVYVVNRVNQDGAFDEVKILMGFPNVESALTAYKNSYERGAHGLSSYVPCSIDQLKWWIKFGDTTKPITTKSLPHDGSIDMNETAWDSNAMPVGTDLPGLMYKMRRDDMGDNLLLDSVSVADIMEDSDGEVALDALVIPFNRLERKMTQMQLVMKATGESVKPVAMQVTPPFKQRGTTNVAVVYELSDGQTVSVYFHNPDSTPNKLTPDDEMVSWKWLLNKKDITILVAPERGQDLNPREVARRIMRIAERNSARFQAANTKRAERMAGIEATKQLVASQEEQLQGLYAEIDSLESKVEAKRSAAPAVEPVAVAAAVLQNEIRDENGEAVGGTVTEPTIAPAEAPAVVEPQANEREHIIREALSELRKHGWEDADGSALATKKYNTLSGSLTLAWLSGGDGYNFSLTAEFESEGRNVLSTSGVLIPVGSSDEDIAALVAKFSANVDIAMRESYSYRMANRDITNPERYAEIMADTIAQLRYQDELDSFFQERIVAVRNAMSDLGWGTNRGGGGWPMMKSGALLAADIKNVGAGANVVGVSYKVVDPKDAELTELVDDLAKTPAEIAAALDASVAASSDASVAPLKSISVTNDLGITFNVVRINKGDSYGADGSLVYEKDDPQIEIYQAGSGSGYGNFIASYLASTMLETERGLSLRYPSEKLVLTPDNVSEIKQWLGGASSSEEDGDAELVSAAVEAAKRGAGGITKILTGQYFTFDFEGEDLILTDELRAKVEAALGAKLVEKVFPGFEGEVALVPADAAEEKAGEGQLFTEDEARAAAAEVTAASGVSPEEYLGDTAFLQSVVDGTVDMLEADFADRLTALYDKYESDPAMMELFNKAAEAYSSAMVEQAKGALGVPAVEAKPRAATIEPVSIKTPKGNELIVDLANSTFSAPLNGFKDEKFTGPYRANIEGMGDGYYIQFSKGKIVIDPSQYEKIVAGRKQLSELRKVQLDAAVPGIEELRTALYAESAYSEKFSRMMEDEGNDGARPPVKPVDPKTVAEKYPRAAAYLKAESYSDASNDKKSSAGRKAMDLLSAGGSIEEAEDILNNWLGDTYID